MTSNEITKKRSLEHELHYRRGLFPEQWSELKELRKKWLIEKGENPNHWDLDCPYFSKKLFYRD